MLNPSSDDFKMEVADLYGGVTQAFPNPTDVILKEKIDENNAILMDGKYSPTTYPIPYMLPSSDIATTKRASTPCL